MVIPHKSAIIAALWVIDQIFFDALFHPAACIECHPYHWLERSRRLRQEIEHDSLPAYGRVVPHEPRVPRVVHRVIVVVVRRRAYRMAQAIIGSLRCCV